MEKGETVAFIPEKSFRKIREVHVLDYLYETQPENVVKICKDTYSLQNHDSMRITESKNLWHWFSRRIGGKGALSYMVKAEEIPFLEACIRLAEIKKIPIHEVKKEGKREDTFSKKGLERGTKERLKAPKTEAEAKRVKLPRKNFDTYALRKYLKERGISDSVVKYCLTHGYIYQSYPRNNVVFVGYDMDGKKRYGCQRGTQGNFKGDCADSDKKYGFSILNKESRELVVFEGPIDLLSFLTCVELTDLKFFSNLPNLLAVGGLSMSEDLAPALSHFLKAPDYPKIQKITTIFDNDEVGQYATEVVKKHLSISYQVRNEVPKYGKDLNDTLIAVQLLNKPLFSRRETEVELQCETLKDFLNFIEIPEENILEEGPYINQLLEHYGKEKIPALDKRFKGLDKKTPDKNNLNLEGERV